MKVGKLRTHRLGIAAGLMAALAAGASLAPMAVAQKVNIAPPAGAPMSFADLIERVSPAVVSVQVTTRSRLRPVMAPSTSSAACRGSMSMRTSSATRKTARATTRAARKPTARAMRWVRASSFARTATSSLTTTWWRMHAK